MFSFFSKPKLLVSSVEKLLIERELCNLVDFFGDRYFRSVTQLRPQDFFDSASQSDDSISGFFEQVRERLDLQSANIRLIESPGQSCGGADVEMLQTDAAILSGKNADGSKLSTLQTDIVVNPGADPKSIPSELIRKLVSAKLIYSGFLDADYPDFDFVADVATVFFGFGMFSANSTVSCCQTTEGTMAYFSIRKLGSINSFGLGYLLAVIDFEKQQHGIPTESELRPDAAESYKRAIKYLNWSNDSLLASEHLRRVDSSSSLSTVESLLQSEAPTHLLWILETLEQRSEFRSDIGQLKPTLFDLLQHRDRHVRQLTLHVLSYSENFTPAELKTLTRISHSKDEWSSALATNILSMHLPFQKIVNEFSNLLNRNDRPAAISAGQISNRIGKAGERFSEDICDRLRIAMNRCDGFLESWYAYALLGICSEPIQMLQTFFADDEELIQRASEIVNSVAEFGVALDERSEPATPASLEDMTGIPAWIHI